jgi:hypothetical protein
VSPASFRTTLSDLLFPAISPIIRVDIDEYRRSWERANGPVDLTQYYTSRWPKEEQVALIRMDFDAYLKGLPPYFRAMLAGTVNAELAGAAGPEWFIHTYMSDRGVARSDSSRTR